MKISSHGLKTFKSRLHPTVGGSELRRTGQGCNVRNGVHHNEAPLGDAIYFQCTLLLLTSSPPGSACAAGVLCAAQRPLFSVTGGYHDCWWI